MAQGDSTSGFFGRLGSSLKSMAKVALQSRAGRLPRIAEADETLIVMGNGPSLRETLSHHRKELLHHRLLAVNFAANAPEFAELKPDYYVMADPVFFNDLDNDNVSRLWRNLSEEVKWRMTLLIPARVKIPVTLPDNVGVARFNPVGVEGFEWLENAAFAAGLGMPRPRNVLIPALMAGIALGFGTIYVVGADHTWSRTLEVTEDNVVVSVQPHFYEDNAAEHARVASVYKNVRLHEIMYSFYVAFRSYFTIRRYAESHGVKIYNSTPGSFIDAFERRPIPEVGDPNRQDGR